MASGRRTRTTPNEVLADTIMRRLIKLNWFKREAKQSLVFPEILEVVENHISAIVDDNLDSSSVQRYNKGALRKDLIKEIKKGKVEAAKALMDLDNMKANSDEVVVIPMSFYEVEGLKADPVMDKYLEDKENEEENYHKAHRDF